MDNSNHEGKILANLIINDLKRLLKKHKLDIEQCPLKPEVMGFFARMLHQGLLTRKQVKPLMLKWFEENLENVKEEEQ